MKRSLVLAVVLILGLMVAATFLSHSAPLAPSPTKTVVLGQQTKTTNCLVQGKLPDPDCTPGALTGATKDQICTPGYSKTVRNVTIQTKDEVYREYGIATHTTGEYEIDHYISLELGGSNDISNLWPESADPRPGFHEKDQVENYLHDQVCQGQISLDQAQQLISHNWLDVYNSISK